MCRNKVLSSENGDIVVEAILSLPVFLFAIR